MQGRKKKRNVYFFFTIVAIFAIADLALNKKYEPRGSTDLVKESRPSNRTAPIRNDPVVASDLPQQGNGNPKAEQKQKTPGSPDDRTRRERQLGSAEKKLALVRKQRQTQSVNSQENLSQKKQNGALVIYNRIPENIKVNVTGNTGKKIEKTIMSLKSIQIEVPMGIYSIQAFDDKRNSISNGKVTVNDELGAAYYVKL